MKFMRITGPKQWSLLWLALLLVSLSLGARANPTEPDEVVRTVSESVLEVITAHKETFDSDPDAYYTSVDSRMSGFIDYESIARAVMAGWFEEATEAQREQFRENFRESLVRSYARALLEFEQQRVEVLPLLAEHRRGNRALVRMDVTGANGRVYRLQYTMGAGEDGQWKVRNVIVDGVNLGRTYRNQFASAMSSGEHRGNLDAVIRNWTATAADS